MSCSGLVWADDEYNTNKKEGEQNTTWRRCRIVWRYTEVDKLLNKWKNCWLFPSIARKGP